MDGYIKLGIAALLPVIVAVILYYIDGKTPFGRLPYFAKQIIFGLIFGGLAIIGTEWGIPVNGAQCNCRDAAVLISGLLFGGPAGVIAGVIGGVERWFAVAWGVGTFTRLACTVTTIVAGIYAALLRKFMFEEKRPGFIMAFAIGVVIEVFHMTMVFITNMATPLEAMNIVKICTPPMVLANALSLMLATLMLTLISGERAFRREKVRISQTIQRWLLLAMLIAFVSTTLFVYKFQDAIAEVNTEDQLENTLLDITSDIRDESERTLLDITRQISRDVTPENIQSIAEKNNAAEVNIVGADGIITASTDSRFVGYDMASGTDSAEFLCLLGETENYAQDFRPAFYGWNEQRKYVGVKTVDGFVEVGFSSENFRERVDSLIAQLVENRHIGETGYVLAVDSNGDIVSTSAVFKERGIVLDKAEMVEANPRETFECTLGGENVFCRYELVEDYIVAVVSPKAEALESRNIIVFVNTIMEVLFFAVLFAMIYMLIREVVVNQLKKVNGSLTKITTGDLDEVVNVRTNEEFALLSDDINSTVDTLKSYIKDAEARIDEELTLAKNIQRSALPNKFPERSDFDIYASMRPAKEVGGDFYDFYLTHSHTLNFAIADVSGKGIPAAMFMMRAKSELKSYTETDADLGEVFTRGNSALCEGNDAGMFVTAWEGTVDLKGGVLRYANAGHNPPLVRHANGEFEYLRSKAGFVLGGIDGVKYKTFDLNLEPGDIIFLYTDGVTEATDSSNQLYGEQRLIDRLNSAQFETMAELCACVTDDVDAFVGEAPQFDDMTMLALKYNGMPPVPSMFFEEASIDDIPVVSEFVESELTKLGCPMKTVFGINIAIDEVYSNIVKYGYGDRKGPVTVEVMQNRRPRGVSLRFIDEGIPYNPLTKEDPDITLSAEERNIGGLGVFMVKKTMDDVKYEFQNDRNILTITKNF